MGQAFDREGNVLGEAEGATKREVFDKLTSEFKDAAEIRIRSVEEGKPGLNLNDPRRAVEARPADNTDPLLQFFVYEHLPEPLQHASEPFCILARKVVAEYPRNPERTVCLRQLLLAKDCAVRTLLYKG